MSGPTLTRFFSFHFVLPFILAALILIHIILLHEKGSNNPLGLNSNQDKISFHPYFTFKDIAGFIALIIILLMVVLLSPNILGDPENFNEANILSTPPHIQPEWYYLFAYAILRSIPNKLGGVIALVLSIAILAILPITRNPNLQSSSFYPGNKTLFWLFVVVALLLT